MLITIIGNSLGEVTAKSVQYSFKEKVSMISDIYDTLGDTGLKTIGWLNWFGSCIELWIQSINNFAEHSLQYYLYQTTPVKKSI